QVRVAGCSVDPARGQLTIDGLRVGDPGGRIDLTIARVFVQVVVRPLLQRVRLERLEIDHPELHLSLDQASAPTAHARRQECLPDVLDRFELGRVTIRKGSVELPDRRVAIASVDAQANVDLRGVGQLDLVRADVIGTATSAFLAGTMSDLCDPRIEARANVRSTDLAATIAAYLPGGPRGLAGTGFVDARITYGRRDMKGHGDLRLRGFQIEGFDPGDLNARFDATRERLKLDRLEVAVGRGQVAGTAELGFGRGHLSGAVTIDAQKVAVIGAQLEAGSSRMQVDGALYTDSRRGLDLVARSEDVSLDDLRGHVADLPWHGHTAVNGRVHGPYADVRIDAAASIRGFEILDVSLG